MRILPGPKEFSEALTCVVAGSRMWSQKRFQTSPLPFCTMSCLRTTTNRFYLKAG